MGEHDQDQDVVAEPPRPSPAAERARVMTAVLWPRPVAFGAASGICRKGAGPAYAETSALASASGAALRADTGRSRPQRTSARCSTRATSEDEREAAVAAASGE